MTIEYVLGDATQPQTPGPKLVAHVCNNVGAWGAGFVLSLSSSYKEPERSYKEWYRSQINHLGPDRSFELGNIQIVPTSRDQTWVANMIAQCNVGHDAGPPIRYDALEKALAKVGQWAIQNQASVHMPRIGCGLAGGKWADVEPIIQRTLVTLGVPVYVYDYAPGGASTVKWR